MAPSYYNIMQQPQRPVLDVPLTSTRRPYSEEECRPFLNTFDGTETPYYLWQDEFHGKVASLTNATYQIEKAVLERRMLDLCHKWAVFDYVTWAHFLGCGNAPPQPALLTHPAAHAHAEHTRTMCGFFGLFWSMYCHQREEKLVGSPAWAKAVADVRAWTWQVDGGAAGGPGKVARSGRQHNQMNMRDARPDLYGAAPAQTRSNKLMHSPPAVTISVCATYFQVRHSLIVAAMTNEYHKVMFNVALSLDCVFSHLLSLPGHEGRFRSLAALFLPPLQASDHVHLIKDPVSLGGALAQTLSIPPIQHASMQAVPGGFQPYVAPHPMQYLGQPPVNHMQANGQSTFFANMPTQPWLSTTQNGPNNFASRQGFMQQRANNASLPGFGPIPASVVASTKAAPGQLLAMTSQSQPQSTSVSTLALQRNQQELMSPLQGLEGMRSVVDVPSFQAQTQGALQKNAGVQPQNGFLSKRQQEIQAMAVRQQQEAARRLQDSAARMLAEEQEAARRRMEAQRRAQAAERLAREHERAQLIARHVEFLIAQCQTWFGDGVEASLQAINAYAYASVL